MGLLDTILGRTKPVKANLDSLFSLPGASLTLQVSAGLVPTGQAGVCFKPPSGQSFDNMLQEVNDLLRTGTGSTGTGPGGTSEGTALEDDAGEATGADLTVKQQKDSFGYDWMVVDGASLDDLVTRVHMVHSTLEENGWSAQLLCSVFGFAPGGSPSDSPMSSDLTTPVLSGSGKSLYLVYLAKRGSFYIFAPSGPEKRDNEEELRIKAVLGTDIPIEPDLERWFPLWNLPLR